MLKGIAGFVTGCILTTLIIYFGVIPGFNKTEHSQDQALSAVQQRSAEQLEKIQNLQGQVQDLQNQIQTITADRDACKSKFDRTTFLYDVGILGGETRAWIIPVDIEPRAFPNKRGTFSHYDPKTQTETVHFNAKSQ